MAENNKTKSAVWKDLDIPALEADVAYFEARLSLVSLQQGSLYQRAQMRTYGVLEEALNSTLDTLRRGSRKS
jgi:hypothetical protein